MNKKSKKSPNPKEPKVETPQAAQPEEPLTLESVQKELDILKELASDHAKQIASMQEALAKKRRPTSNGKVQILDKLTGKIYPSKNSAYQTLLKAGELKELVDKGVFGPEPEKNTFGWYALVRAWPDRFEERKVEESPENK